MSSLLLVRHGETIWNLEQRIQGRSNSDLTTLGREQAKINGTLLLKLGVRKVIASPAGRVQETLHHMGIESTIPIEFDDRLLERDMGLWECLKWDEVKDYWRHDYLRCRANPNIERPPHGESLNDVENRLSTLLQDLLHHNQNVDSSSPIALVSHGGTNRSILGWFGVMSQHRFQDARFHNDVIYWVRSIGDHVHIAHYVAGAGPFDGAFTAKR